MTRHTEPQLYGFTVSELAEILFCSTLQPSQDPGPRAVRAAMYSIMNRGGDVLARCAEELATRYGDDPDGASRRMRWARREVLAVAAVAAAA